MSASLQGAREGANLPMLRHECAFSGVVAGAGVRWVGVVRAAGDGGLESARVDAGICASAVGAFAVDGEWRHERAPPARHGD